MFCLPSMATGGADLRLIRPPELALSPEAAVAALTRLVLEV